MKKFSNISGFKPGEEPKQVERTYTEEELTKIAILSILEKSLRVGIYGNINPVISGSLKVEGMDYAAGLIANLLKSDELKEQIKVLQSVKESSTDWKSIDSKIDELTSSINEEATQGQLLKAEDEIKALLKSADKKDDILEFAKIKSERIKNGKRLNSLSIACQSLKKYDKYAEKSKLLDDISEIFKFRSSQIGYR